MLVVLLFIFGGKAVSLAGIVCNHAGDQPADNKRRAHVLGYCHLIQGLLVSRGNPDPQMRVLSWSLWFFRHGGPM